MLYKTDKIIELMNEGVARDRLCVIPSPDFEVIKDSGEASLDFRLGRWFTTFRQTRTPHFDMIPQDNELDHENKLTKRYFVPFGANFYLHPGKFVLGITVEWVKLPAKVAGFITGKSSLGRRGLIIETASGIHPGFSGCLTLELTNVGEIPLAIVPGMKICQVFFHEASDGGLVAKSSYDFRRRPSLGSLKPDVLIDKLKKPL